jgi:AcrR family transcriptional regulator
VRAITRAARANLGAVTYYFGSKERLRLEVLITHVSAIAARLQSVAEQSLPARERLAQCVQAIFAQAAEHPAAPRLFVRWLLHHDRVPAELIAQQRTLVGVVARVIQEGTAAGEFRAVDPVCAAFSVLSQCIWFHLIRGVAAQVTGTGGPFARPEGATVMATHITDVILRAFAAEQAA